MNWMPFGPSTSFMPGLPSLFRGTSATRLPPVFFGDDEWSCRGNQPPALWALQVCSKHGASLTQKDVHHVGSLPQHGQVVL